MFWSWRFLVVTCSGPDICDMSCSLCDLWAWPWAMKLRLTVRPLTDWLLIVCTRLLSTLSPPPHTHSLIRGILGEFMHRLLANWISHIVSTVCPLWMPHNVGLHGTDPPPTTTPHPQQRHDDHGLFIVFQSATRLRLHHWTIINQLNRTGPGGSSHL